MAQNFTTWCEVEKNPLETSYHDQRWAMPITDKQELFALLMLECQQAGLSWAVVLKKEQALGQAFLAWDPQALAQMSDAYIEVLKDTPEIIRHTGKILAMRSNAQAFLRLEQQGIDFSQWLWSHDLDASTLSKQLKKWGFKFVGPTTAQAYLEAVGKINPHHPQCPCYARVEQAQQAVKAKYQA